MGNSTDCVTSSWCGGSGVCRTSVPLGLGRMGFLLSGSMGFSVLLFKKESPTYPHITP